MLLRIARANLNGINQLWKNELLIKIESFCNPLTDCKDLHCPDSASPHSRHGDHGRHVLVLPRLALPVEEVQRHGGAHAVAHQDHPPTSVGSVRRLNEALEGGKKLAVLV